jgi:ABC-type multidrug transport system fused ATPase/permease subunit
MLELQSGKIELDGVDISRVQLDVLRQRSFITVTQDTLLLPNETLRFNLDPGAMLSDDILIDALTKTGLWLHFSISVTNGNAFERVEADNSVDILGIETHPILDKELSGFQELSVGQSQLFALCRALIKANVVRDTGVKPVVLLDEVTSSLDAVTESTIHGIIDEELTSKGHTVIIVAHRLSVLAKHTKPRRDVMVLIEDGRLREVNIYLLNSGLSASSIKS